MNSQSQDGCIVLTVMNESGGGARSDYPNSVNKIRKFVIQTVFDKIDIKAKELKIGTETLKHIIKKIVTFRV